MLSLTKNKNGVTLVEVLRQSGSFRTSIRDALIAFEYAVPSRHQSSVLIRKVQELNINKVNHKKKSF